VTRPEELDARSRRLRAALAAVLLASASASAAEMKRPMLCESREAAIVGYYNNDPGRPEGAVKRSTALERQETNSQWRIDPLPSGTEVLITRYGGTFQQIEEPEVWALESDPAAIGWLLKAKRSGGRSPETITITSATLHFVYSSQHVNPFYNRAAVWLGQCRTAP